jgi:hypothetical protein
MGGRRRELRKEAAGPGLGKPGAGEALPGSHRSDVGTDLDGTLDRRTYVDTDRIAGLHGGRRGSGEGNKEYG